MPHETTRPASPLPERLETVTVNGRIETLIRTRLGNQAICTSGSGRTDAESAAIAVEIVRRWNAHASLVAACSELVAEYSAGGIFEDRIDTAAVTLARSALAAATEGGAA